jgi:hypothetical protein
MSFGAIYSRNGTQRQALGDRTSNCLKLDHDQCATNINENGVPFIPIYNPPEYITRQAMYVKRSIEARSFYHYCRGKTKTITYCECVCIQQKMRMSYIVICDLPLFTICIFPTFSHKRHDFKKIIEHKKCVLISL